MRKPDLGGIGGVEARRCCGNVGRTRNREKAHSQERAHLGRTDLARHGNVALGYRGMVPLWVMELHWAEWVMVLRRTELRLATIRASHDRAPDVRSGVVVSA